jgi:hypothetical protein
MSAVLARRLGETLQTKERAEGYKANLQRLKAEGTVNEENYNRMLQGYEKSLVDASRELTEVRVSISQELERSERELAALREEVAALQVRRNVGELSQPQFERMSRPLEKRIQALEAHRDVCARLQVANSTADLPSTNSRASTVVPGKTMLGGRQISIPERAAFTEFSSVEEMTTPRFKALGLASGILLLISVLAKWIGSEKWATIAGADVSIFLLVVGLLGAAAAVYSSLLIQPQARGFLHLGVATLGILVFLGVLLTFSFKSVAVFDLGGASIQMERGAVHFREGFYLYLVALAGMIYYGYKETKVEN